MKKSLITLVFCLATICSCIYGQTARKYSNEFLAIGVGANGLGMSNSNVALVNDVTAGYWNPAGLLSIKSDLQVGAMHSEYFAGIAKYDYAAIGKPIDENSALGFSFIRFGVDDIPNTTELIDAQGNWDYDRISSFSAVDYAFIGSYAKKLKKEGLNVGVNAKIIHRRVGDFGKAWGFGLDLGLQYLTEKWRWGIMAKDVTSTYNAWSYNLNDATKQTFVETFNEIPVNSVELTLPQLVLGGAKQFDIKNKINIAVELDVDATFDGLRNTLIKSNYLSLQPHAGLEFGYVGVLFIRGGIGNIQEVKDQGYTFQPNFGIGLKIKGITLDYALTDIGDNSVALYSNVFSLKFNIFKPEIQQ